MKNTKQLSNNNLRGKNQKLFKHLKRRNFWERKSTGSQAHCKVKKTYFSFIRFAPQD